VKISVIFTKAGSVGGSETLALKVIEEALKKKGKVQLSFYGKEILKDPKIKELVELGLGLHEIYLPETKSVFGKVLFYLYKKRNLFSLFKGITRFNPDRILISQGGTYDLATNPSLSQFLLENKFPFFVVSQFHSETGTLDAPIREQARKIFFRAQKVFFVSQRNKEMAEMFLAKSIENAAIINNPIKFMDRSQVEYPINTTIIQIACVARLESKIKGQNILIKILSSNKWKEREWNLNFYGEGPDLAYLKELTQYFKISDKVNFCGFAGDIRKVWKENHVLVLPSLAEGTPLSLIEANICGRTAVVTDVGGNSDLVVDGLTGFLADSNSMNAFGKALERAWQQKDSWKEMGLKAKENVQNSIDLKIEESLLKIITKLN
jgi:glycosyltransferase involved in cell wall biosynthesis